MILYSKYRTWRIYFILEHILYGIPVDYTAHASVGCHGRSVGIHSFFHRPSTILEDAVITDCSTISEVNKVGQ